MEHIYKFLSNLLGIEMITASRMVLSVIILFILWAARLITLKISLRGVIDPHLHYKWRKNSSYIAFTIGFFLIGRIWFEGVQSIATFLGLLSAGLAIALKDPITDLVGWLFVLWRQPFQIGDRIQIGDVRGDVIDLRIFKFTLNEIGNWVDADQSTGRVIHVPNHKVFVESLANYNSEFRFIWNEIPVLITFESDWKIAKKILMEIVEKHAMQITDRAQKEIRKAARSFLIYYNVLTPTVYTNVKDSGVMLTIRYLTDPRKRRSTQEAIWEDILEQFASQKDIDLAYPTTRIYYNPKEGKGINHDQDGEISPEN